MPQPVDFQTEVAKVSAAERVQEIASRASLAAQQRLAAAEQESRIETETQVQQPAQTEDLQVETEGHRKNPFVGRRRRRRQAPEPEAKKPDTPKFLLTEGEPGADKDGEGHRLDVTI